MSDKWIAAMFVATVLVVTAGLTTCNGVSEHNITERQRIEVERLRIDNEFILRTQEVTRDAVMEIIREMNAEFFENMAP